ncbi:MAG: hypothetical protein K0R28_6200 [Paenibacillus sp.]|jgi:hypothetical protein|nr:hypothetical protein [Paenibacillus sp.]
MIPTLLDAVNPHFRETSMLEFGLLTVRERIDRLRALSFHGK